MSSGLDLPDTQEHPQPKEKTHIRHTVEPESARTENAAYKTRTPNLQHQANKLTPQKKGAEHHMNIVLGKH